MRLLLTKYSHHFTVTRIEPPAEQILIGYSRALTSYQTTRKINGDVISTPHKTFADRNILVLTDSTLNNSMPFVNTWMILDRVTMLMLKECTHHLKKLLS